MPIPAPVDLKFTAQEAAAAAEKYGTGQQIGVDDFDDVYRPIVSQVEPGENPVMEFAEARTYPVNHVWTLVDGDDNNSYATTGFHVVNKFGYVVTEVPWTTEDEIALWFEDPEGPPNADTDPEEQ